MTTTGLDKKLLTIMGEIDFIPKTGTNDFHKYNFVQEAFVLEKMRGLFLQHGVLILPEARIATQHDDLTLIDVTFTLVDTDSGDTRTVAVPGAGTDKGDKGVYKAVTGAYKYLLLKLFMVPTGDDPESFADTDQRKYGQQPARQQSARSQSKGQEFDVSNLPTWKGEDAEYLCDGCGSEIKATARTPLTKAIHFSTVGDELLCYNCRKASSRKAA